MKKSFFCLSLFLLSLTLNAAEPGINRINEHFTDISGFSFTADGGTAVNANEWKSEANGAITIYSSQKKYGIPGLKEPAQKVVVERDSSGHLKEVTDIGYADRGMFHVRFAGEKAISMTKCTRSGFCATTTASMCELAKDRLNVKNYEELNAKLKGCAQLSSAFTDRPKDTVSEEVKNGKILKKYGGSTISTLDASSNGQAAGILYLQWLGEMCESLPFYSASSSGSSDPVAH